MTPSSDTNAGRNRRALMALAVALVMAAVVYFWSPSSSSSVSVISGDPSMLQQRLVRLRQVAASEPQAQAFARRTAADLAEREQGMLQAATAAQAQAALFEIASRIGKAEQIDVRGGDLAAPKAFGDYGLVFATVNFECHVEQLVNFLDDFAKEPELVAPAEERIVSANSKEKLMTVRMVLAGVVPRKLVPEKKGLF